MTEHEQGAEIAAAVGAAAGSTITRAEIVDDWLLALTFGPISAALFFGSLLPLAAGSALPLGVCAAFGVGSALPVAASGVALAAGTAGVASRFARLRSLEVWGRRLTAGIFLGAGCYLMAKTLGG